MAEFSQEFLELLENDVLAASPLLLGCRLIRGELSAQIVEVEAYRTPDDAGCHAHRGETPRMRSMFGPAGHALVYFTYGNHWMINLVAHQERVAAAILIRAAEPLTGLDTMYLRRPRAKRDEVLLSGPGKLTAAFGITGDDDGAMMLDQSRDFRIEPGELITDIEVGTRIGLATGKGDGLPWRFMDRNRMRWVSRPLPKTYSKA